MFEITRYILKLRANEGGYLSLPLDSTEQLGTVFAGRRDAVEQLREVYNDIRRYPCTDEYFDGRGGYFSLTCHGVSVVGNVVEIRLPLTQEEFVKAGMAYEDTCKTEDCRNAIYGFAGYDPYEDDEAAENLIAAQSFLDKYGVSVCDLAEGAGEETEQLRKKIIERFDKIFDANIDPNSLWENAVRQVLSERLKDMSSPKSDK